MPVEIVNRLSPRQPISNDMLKVLRAMFAQYDKVTINQTFNRGLSGSAVYLARPYKGNRPELPTVVKIDHYDRMNQEAQAIDELIGRHLPNAVTNNEHPITPSGSKFAGLRYPMAGGGVFEVTALYDFCRTNQVERCQPVFKRIFAILDQLYGARSINHDLALQTYYDDALPNNLVIDCSTNPNSFDKELTPHGFATSDFELQNIVQLDSNWIVTEYDWSKQGLTLNSAGNNFKHRLQVTGLPDFEGFEIGVKLGRSLRGVVTKTRRSILLDAAQQIVGSSVNLAFPYLPVPDHFPNPLYYLNDILYETLSGYIGPIHGDLNLENILVELEGNNVHIIDFAKSRETHIIRDFLQLEMNLTTTLLTEAMLTAGGHGPILIKEFYDRLHCATQGENVSAPAGLEKPFALIQWVRQTARDYLFRRNNLQEYYYGLFIYLLGSLRYAKVAKQPGLDALAKQTAFYGAATILNIIENPDSVNCASFATSNTTKATAPATTTTSTPSTTSQPTAAPAPPRPFSEMKLSDMRNAIVKSFGEGELRDFIFDLGIDPEQLGRYKSELARELIEYYRRRNNLETLQKVLYEARPEAAWWG